MVKGQTDRQTGRKETDRCTDRLSVETHEELTAVLFITPVSTLSTAVAAIYVGDAATISTLKLCLFITGSCGQDVYLCLITATTKQ